MDDLSAYYANEDEMRKISTSFGVTIDQICDEPSAFPESAVRALEALLHNKQKILFRLAKTQKAQIISAPAVILNDYRNNAKFFNNRKARKHG